MPQVNDTVNESVKELPTFPGEHPARHAAREWMEKYNDKVATHKLQTAQRGELPLRVQHLRNWPASMTSVPNNVASGMDPAQLYKAQADAAKRQHDNEENDQRVKIAVLEDQSALFTLLTEPMVSTAPLLRDTLRAKCAIGNTGYFHGQTAYRLVLEHLQEVQDEGADKDYYQSAEEALRKPANRLPNGCTATHYATRVRNFTHKINPHLERPYVGTGIGDFIIDLMPQSYDEAGERIRADMKAKGMLHDALTVSRECLKIVHKRAKKDNATVSAFAVSDGALDAMLQEGTPLDDDALLAGGPRKPGATRKPPGWKPNLRTEFCAGCPHGDKTTCWSDPRKAPDLPDTVLTNHGQYDRIAARRESAAKALGIRAKAMPPKKQKQDKSEPSAPTTDVKGEAKGEAKGSKAGAEPHAPVLDSWYEGLVDVSDAQFVNADDTLLQLAQVPQRSSGAGARDGVEGECEECEECEELDGNDEDSTAVYVVYEGRATGVVQETFARLRTSHLAGHSDPVYECFDTLEEAHEAWAQHMRRMVDQPPSLAGVCKMTAPSVPVIEAMNSGQGSSMHSFVPCIHS